MAEPEVTVQKPKPSRRVVNYVDCPAHGESVGTWLGDKLECLRCKHAREAAEWTPTEQYKRHFCRVCETRIVLRKKDELPEDKCGCGHRNTMHTVVCPHKCLEVKCQCDRYHPRKK